MLVTIVYRSTARLESATINACPADVNSVILEHAGEPVKLVVNDKGAFLVKKGRNIGTYQHATKVTLLERYAKYLPFGVRKGNQLILTV